VSANQAPTKATQVKPAVHPSHAEFFCRWLNTQRQNRGLGIVRLDPGLNYTAYQNNLHQASRGLGHIYRNGDRRQNVGVGDRGAVWHMWIASPAHASALFDPSVTRIGYDIRYGYSTYCGS
jgi:hypothetical protein